MNNYNCCNCSKKSPVFQHLNDDELNLVNRHKTTVKYKAGEIIIKQGSPQTHVISFTSGIAKVYIEGNNNKNLILQFIKPTQFLGEPGIYVDNLHHFSISTIEDSQVCYIELEIFKKLVRTNIAFAEAMMINISQNGIFNYNRFISLTQKNMPGRIADALIYLKKDIYTDSDQYVNISRQDIAEFTGMSKDSAIRILKEFEVENIITLVNRKICINKPERLNQISRTC